MEQFRDAVMVAITDNDLCSTGLLIKQQVFLSECGPSNEQELLALVCTADQYDGYWYGYVRKGTETEDAFTSSLILVENLINATSPSQLFFLFHDSDEERLCESFATPGASTFHESVENLSKAIRCFNPSIHPRAADITDPFRNGIFGVQKADGLASVAKTPVLIVLARIAADYREHLKEHDIYPAIIAIGSDFYIELASGDDPIDRTTHRTIGINVGDWYEDHNEDVNAESTDAIVTVPDMAHLTAFVGLLAAAFKSDVKILDPLDKFAVHFSDWTHALAIATSDKHCECIDDQGSQWLVQSQDGESQACHMHTT